MSPVGAGSVSAGRQGDLVAEPRPRPHPRQHQPRDHTGRGGAANFGFISITYHQYIFGLYKYIL